MLKRIFLPEIFHFEYEHMYINQYRNMLCALCRLYNRQCFQTRITFLFISILLLWNQLIILLPLLWVHIMKVMPLTKNNLYQMYFCMINELTTFLPTNSSLFAVSLQSNQILNLLLMVNGLLQWPCTVKSFFCLLMSWLHLLLNTSLSVFEISVLVLND